MMLEKITYKTDVHVSVFCVCVFVSPHYPNKEEPDNELKKTKTLVNEIHKDKMCQGTSFAWK